MTDPVARLGVLVRQIQGALGGNRIVRGAVGSGGALAVGEGWTSVKNSTGDYTVTFSTAFKGAPVVVVSAGQSAGTLYAKLKSGVDPTVTSFTVNTVNSGTSALADSIFTFVAVGP